MSDGPAGRSSYDVQTMLAALRMIRKVAAQPALAQHIVRETRPGPDAADDDALLEHVRKTGQTSYHPIIVLAAAGG